MFNRILPLLFLLTLGGLAAQARPAQAQLPQTAPTAPDTGAEHAPQPAAPQPAAPQPAAPDTIRLWENVTPALEQALEHEDQHQDLPDSAWFGPDKRSNRADINALLDQAMTELALPSGKDYRGQIDALEQRIITVQQETAALRQRRISAPEEALWGETVADIDAQIKTNQQHIERLRGQISAQKKAFAEEIRGLGLNMSDEQLDFLLSTVIGDDIVGLSVAFDNVKVLTTQLEQLLVDSGEDITTARRYYGLYTVLLAALERLHQSLLSSIQGYLGELDAIQERTSTLLAESKALRQKDSRHQRTLAANIEAQRLTLRTAKLYRDYLISQAKDINQSKQRLAHDIAVARNTYETVKVSGELVRLVQAGQTLLETLFSREVPTMFTFQNLEMKREFEKLTIRLRETEQQ